jgi:integrase
MSIRVKKYANKDGSSSVKYLAVVSCGQGRQATKQFERRVDAEKWERKTRSELDAGNLFDINHALTLEALVKRWLERRALEGKEQSTCLREDMLLRLHVLPNLGSFKVGSIRPVIVEKWLTELSVQRQLSPKTVNMILALLKKIFSDSVRSQIIVHNPVALVRGPRSKPQCHKFWTKDEVTRFLDYVRIHAPQLSPVYSVALYTGMRRGEVAALQWDDVDMSSRFIRICRNWDEWTGTIKPYTKNKKVRSVPINSRLFEVLSELRPDAETGKLVFPNFGAKNAHRRLAELATQANVPVIRFHDLRHTFASNFTMDGGAPQVLQSILGHHSITMTERYSHLSPKFLFGQTEILSY